jgi:hypothetical protein
MSSASICFICFFLWVTASLYDLGSIRIRSRPLLKKPPSSKLGDISTTFPLTSQIRFRISLGLTVPYDFIVIEAEDAFAIMASTRRFGSDGGSLCGFGLSQINNTAIPTATAMTITDLKTFIRLSSFYIYFW